MAFEEPSLQSLERPTHLLSKEPMELPPNPRPSRDSPRGWGFLTGAEVRGHVPPGGWVSKVQCLA